jgi:two-component system cell cycle sensor histidine kinase PleC
MGTVLRSAESSGVVAGGFNTENLIMPSVRQHFVTAIPQRVPVVSRINWTITVSALFAASLFVAFDAIRTIEEGKTRLELTTRAMVAELSQLSTDTAAVALLRSAPKQNDLVASLRDPLGQLVASTRTSIAGAALLPAAISAETPTSVSAELGEAGFLDVALDEATAMQGVWQRGAAAFAFAFMMIGFTIRRPAAADRAVNESLLNSIREEQRLLARRYHEEKLRAEAASRSKTSFLAHLSHDVRTPLNHIIGFAELLRHQAFGPLGDPRYLGYADTIKLSGERLLASFATILDLAELEGGKKPLREEPVDVDDLLEGIAERFRPQAQRRGLSFVLKPACGATMTADRFCLERMLGNVVENAIRFNRAGGKVTLAAFAATDGVVLEVTDTGIGMTEEKLASLSQPFVFGDATFTKDTSDSGLGIAIARTIAELSGGRLAIDSSPALGTTVAISLPLKANSEARAA